MPRFPLFIKQLFLTFSVRKDCTTLQVTFCASTECCALQYRAQTFHRARTTRYGKLIQFYGGQTQQSRATSSALLPFRVRTAEKPSILCCNHVFSSVSPVCEATVAGGIFRGFIADVIRINLHDTLATFTLHCGCSTYGVMLHYIVMASMRDGGQSTNP